ncbi:unnamed protein product [Heterobilharzia americana]|nr:unnamed protein product [Heterobilharzia americana]
MSATSSGFLESRPTVLNGFPSNLCPPSNSSMPLNNQFPSLFPVTQQQPLPLQQQLSLGSAVNHQSTSGLPTRLGATSHPMINQTPFAMCSSGSGPSYTPPFVPGYMQPVCNSSSVIHPNTNYASHLLNGFGSSLHVGTACAPAMGNGVQLGAERRRQANILNSVTSSSMVYPNMSANNSLTMSINSATPVMNNPLAAMHPQAPSQQCSVNSNANSLLVAFTMNWMQQQQQQQHSNLMTGGSGAANSHTNWPPPMWPSNNLGNTFPVNCPPMKVPPGNPSEINIYNNSAMLPNTLPTVNGVAGQQHQQSMMVAAMAAMANMYPWNNGSSSGNSGMLSGVSGGSAGGPNRWMCPQGSTAFPGVNPSTSQPFYQEQYPSLKPSGGANSGVHPGSSHHS